jgi:osmotically-inducible protein OsmY
MNANRFAAGLALGAGLAYLFDPERGHRRRAVIRDKMIRISRKSGETADAWVEDLKNRMHGTYAALRSSSDWTTVSDDVLAARVRSQLGRVVSNPHAIDVTSLNGTVTLNGPICADEESRALQTARNVRGVRNVENALEPFESSDHVPSLQGTNC